MNKVKVGDLPTGAVFVTPLTHKLGSVRTETSSEGIAVYIEGAKKVLHPNVLVVKWATEVGR